MRASVRHFETALRRLVPALAQATTARSAKSPARTLRLSPERRRALELQGRYLGYMRQLKPGQKAKVRAAKAKNGMKAAIAMAKRLAKR